MARSLRISNDDPKGIMNFVAIDFETANYARDSACAIGLVKVVGGENVDKAVHLIKPPTREFVFTYIHGLTWMTLRARPISGSFRRLSSRSSKARSF